MLQKLPFVGANQWNGDNAPRRSRIGKRAEAAAPTMPMGCQGHPLPDVQRQLPMCARARPARLVLHILYQDRTLKNSA